MRNQTCENAAEAIMVNGGGKDLIIQALKAVYGQGYERGYNTRISDVAKAKLGKRKAIDKSFKGELDMIDDVMKSKWL